MRKGDYAYFKDLLKDTYGSVRSAYQNKVNAAELLLAPRNIRVKKYKGNLYEVDIPEDNGSNYIEFYEDATPEFKEQIKSVLAHGLPSELKEMPEYKEAERKFYEENGTDESFEKSLIDDALFEMEHRKVMAMLTTLCLLLLAISWQAKFFLLSDILVSNILLEPSWVVLKKTKSTMLSSSLRI